MKQSRKERRQEARANKTPFEPQYNGEGVITREQYRKKKFTSLVEEVEKSESLNEKVEEVEETTTTI